MFDQITVIPYQCGESDCTAQWHKSSYYQDESGETSVDSYDDGDLQPTDHIPTIQEQDYAWAEYAKYVVRFGIDPLNEFRIKQDYLTRERWEAKFFRSLRGYYISEIRRRRVKYNPDDLPQHVKEFMLITGTKNIWGNPLIDITPDEFKREKLKTGVWNVIYIDHRVPRKPTAIKRDLLRAAKQSI